MTFGVQEDCKADDKQITKHIFSFLFKVLYPFRYYVLAHVVSLGLFCIATFGLLPTAISSMANDSASVKEVFAWVVGLNIVVGLSVKLYRRVVWVHLVPKLQTKLASIVLDRTVVKPYSFFQNQLSGDISKKRTDIIDTLPTLYYLLMDGFVLPLIMVAAGLFSLKQLPIRYALYMSVWIVSLILAFYIKSKKMSVLCEKIAQNDAELNGLSTDIMNNMMSVKLFSREQYELDLFEKGNQMNLKQKQIMESIYDNVLTFYSVGFICMLIYSGRSMAQDYHIGLLDVANIVLFLNLATVLVSRLWSLAGDMERYIVTLGRLRPAFKLLLQDQKEPTVTKNQAARIDRGEIVFDNVTFGYNSDLQLFKDLNVRIGSGESVGLVGYSGAGKTSFVNLILNLYSVQAGAVKIDNQPVDTIPLDILYSSISMITQDCYLFNRSVADNIAYGDINAPRAKVIEAAKMACAHDFIMSLEHGYDTNVGEKGSKLSGGQRQRIMIARSIMKNSKIIIMDEVTSQLDSANEAIIQQNMMDLMKDKTTVVIAHRLSTLRLMDRLLVFENGRIVEDGSHDQLIAKGGLYADLWNNQIGHVGCDINSRKVNAN